MKVLHCINSAKIGGIERLVIELAIAQKEQGIDVTLMVDRSDGEFNDYLQKSGITVKNSGIKSGFDIRLRKLQELKQLFRQYDIIHLHNFVFLLSWAGLSAKTVYTIHGLSKGIRRENLIKYYLRETLKKYFLNRVDYFIANSAYSLSMAKKHYGLKHVSSKVILNGIRLPEISILSYREIQHIFTVGLVSRFVLRKRVDRLINAFAEFLNKGGKGKLILVGDGPEDTHIKDLINEKKLNENVEMPGFIINVHKYYNKFDICVHPSDNEGFGLIGVEAYINGKPVIAFRDSGGLKEVIEPLEPENIVDNEEGLTQRIMYYYNHREEISLKSIERIKYAKANFSIDRMGNDYMEVYRSVLTV